jgi:hypothetical protein
LRANRAARSPGELKVSFHTVSRTALRLGFPAGPGPRTELNWEPIRREYEAGATPATLKRRFGLSNGAWDRAVSREDIVLRPRGQRKPPGATRSLVAELLAEGKSQADICRDLQLAKGTVAYHARALGIAADQRFARRIDWGEVQRAYDSGLSIRECASRFGFAKCSWSAAVKRGVVKSRKAGTPSRRSWLLGGSATAPMSRGDSSPRG